MGFSKAWFFHCVFTLTVYSYFKFEKDFMNRNSARMSSDHSMETCSCCMQPVTSVCQTLEEIDFERGIWSAAVNGDTERVRKILSGGENPDVPDSSSFTALVSERDSFDIISPVLCVCPKADE